MNKRLFSNQQNFWLWAILASVLFSMVALAPQFDLWKTQGENWKGSYAINESDEPAYATYIQSILEGKPRRNSPYSGRIDSSETPQKESLFSIQFISTYPIVFLAKAFGLSTSGAMILLGIIAGAFAAFAVYWLIFILTENASASFVATTTVLFLGSIVAGHGFLISYFFEGIPNYYLTTMFLRRANPAVSFPILFFFFIAVWKFLNAESSRDKIISSIASLLCFAGTVYAYFFHWTTALAWIGGLMLLYITLRFEDFRKNIFYLLGLGFGLIAILIPYAILLSNRAKSMDSAQLLTYTREPDLLRGSEIISYLTILALVAAHRYGTINIREVKYVFLLSLALLSPLVFNQQIITGHSLQPFHYEFFCANYSSLTAGISVLIILLSKKIQQETFQKVLVIFGAFILVFGYLDILFTVELYKKQNIWRDELKPVAEKIKAISEETATANKMQKPVIFSTDLAHDTYFSGTDLPTFSSQPILWSPHLSMFPDIEPEENSQRFMDFLYYHNFDGAKARDAIEVHKHGLLIYGFFGPGRTLAFLSAEHKPVTADEIDSAIDKFEKFQSNYSFEDAKKTPFSFVVVHKEDKFDFSRIDRWYERDQGEVIGDNTLYRVKLKQN